MRLSQTRRSPKKVGRPAASAARALRESNQANGYKPAQTPNIKPSFRRMGSSAGSSRSAASSLKRAAPESDGPAPKRRSAGDQPLEAVDESTALSELHASREDNERLTCEVERLNTARSAWEGRAAEQAAELERLHAEIEAARRELSAQVTAAEESAAAAEAARAAAQAEAEATAARVAGLESSLAATVASVTELTCRTQAQEELRRQMHETIQALRGNIRVFCRVRGGGGEAECAVSVPAGQVEDTVLEIRPVDGAKGGPQRFQFDHAFGAAASQEDVFLEVSQLTQSALDGHNVAIFAYGQTGSGKTYTMEGPGGDPGVTPRAIERLFAHAAELSALGSSFEFEVSCLEVYNEEVRDLLAPPPKGAEPAKLKLQDLAGVVCVQGLKSTRVAAAEEVAPLLAAAQRVRSTASTKMNDRSSRSHYVFRMRIRRREGEGGECRESELYLVDLAGTERVEEWPPRGPPPRSPRGVSEMQARSASRSQASAASRWSRRERSTSRSLRLATWWRRSPLAPSTCRSATRSSRT